MDRAAVVERLAPLTRVRAQTVESGPNVRVLVGPDGTTLRRGRSAPLDFAPEGIRSLMGATGLTQRVVDQISPATAGTVLTEILGRQPRYTVVTQEGRIVELAKEGQYHHVDAGRVVTAIERANGEVDFHRLIELPHYTARLELVTTQEAPVTRGDLVRAGAVVQFSTLGITRPLVQAFTQRLVCTNGATASDYLQEFTFGGEGDNLYQWFRQSLRGAIRSVAGVVERYRLMAGRELPAEERAHILEGLLRAAGLHNNRPIAGAVHARALEAPPQTEWDAFNLLTWATSHTDLNGLALVRAQNAIATWAGETEHRRVCPACGHAH